MPIQPEIQVEGLAATQRALKKLGDTDTPKAIKAAGKSAANVVIDVARVRIPHRTGRAAGSLRAGASAKFAYVKGGTKAVPYMGSLEFGGYPQGRPFVPNGRYIFPAAQDNTARIVSVYETEVSKAIGGVV